MALAALPDAGGTPGITGRSSRREQHPRGTGETHLGSLSVMATMPPGRRRRRASFRMLRVGPFLHGDEASRGGYFGKRGRRRARG